MELLIYTHKNDNDSVWLLMTVLHFFSNRKSTMSKHKKVVGSMRYKNVGESDQDDTKVITGIGFDNTDNARYESMRHKMQHGRLYRRHQDLTREFERQIVLYDKLMDNFSTDVDKYKLKVENRFNRLVSNSTDKSKAMDSNGPTLTQTNKSTLLFSVHHRDGEEYYINRLNQSDQEDVIQRGKSPKPKHQGAQDDVIQRKKSPKQENIPAESFITERKVSRGAKSPDHSAGTRRTFFLRELTM